MGKITTVYMGGMLLEFEIDKQHELNTEGLSVDVDYDVAQSLPTVCAMH